MVRLLSVRVLVIDDDPAVCRKLAGWLHEAVCDAATFTVPDEGLLYAGRVRCHVALVDLRLGGADGAEVIASLRRTCPDTRVIALAAFPEVRQIVAALRAGACDVLEKPIQPPVLRAALDRQLRELGLDIRSEEEFNRRLGARLRALRTAAGRTLAEVSAGCGLTANQLSQIELGKSATTTWSLARICGALEVPLARLLSEL